MRKRDHIEGFERGEHLSDGQITCDNQCGEDHLIRRGAVVFYHQTSVEYDEWRPACRKHAMEEAAQDYSDLEYGPTIPELLAGGHG